MTKIPKLKKDRFGFQYFYKRKTDKAVGQVIINPLYIKHGKQFRKYKAELTAHLFWLTKICKTFDEAKKYVDKHLKTFPNQVM